MRRSAGSTGVHTPTPYSPPLEAAVVPNVDDDRPGHPRPDPGVNPTAMAIAITIPRLGWNMDEGVFVGWLKQDGEAIRAGDPLFTLEGEKAAQDIEAIEAGYPAGSPRRPRPPATVVAVGTVIGYLLGTGRMPSRSTAAALGASPRWRPQRPSRPDSLGDGRRSPSVGIDPRIVATARGSRRWRGGWPASWASTGRGSRGSGCTGRIRKVDVLAAARTGPIGSPRRECIADSPGRSVPIGPTRRTIAARMVQSRAGDGAGHAARHGGRDEPGEPPRPVQGGRAAGTRAARATWTSSSS